MCTAARVRNTVFLLATLVAASAGANPMASARLLARQVPKTQHVQITVATAFGTMTVGSLQRNGNPLPVQWTPIGGFSTNLGSGVRSVPGGQYCDCDLPIGDYSYSVPVTQSTYTMDVTASVQVVEGYDSVPDAGAVSPDAWPWEIPDPAEIQGLDCVNACQTDAGTTPPSDGAAGGAPIATTTGGAPATSEQPNPDPSASASDSGCAVSSRGPARGALWMLVSCLLIAIGRLRRSQPKRRVLSQPR
jgi:hypothetical protein